MNYATLFETVKGYLENDFPSISFSDTTGSGTATFNSVEQINTFITQAEQKIFNSVQFPSLRKNVTGVTSGGNKYLACPDDFLAVYSMAVIDGDGAYHFMLNKDVNFIREAYPTPTDTGRPEYYALFGPATTNTTPATITNELTFLLGPTPNTSYSVELHYFYYPQSITTSATGTSWLGDNFDSILLNGSMVEAASFMKSDADTLKMYVDRFNESLLLAKRLGDGMERGDAYRNGQVRVPVR